MRSDLLPLLRCMVNSSPGSTHSKDTASDKREIRTSYLNTPRTLAPAGRLHPCTTPAKRSPPKHINRQSHSPRGNTGLGAPPDRARARRVASPEFPHISPV